MKNVNYKPTILACFIGYVVQAINITFAPLLYITFQNQYSLTLSKISLLIAVCFSVQLLIDAMAVKFSDKMNPRATVICANLLAALGIAGLGIFPLFLPPFLGLLLGTVLSNIGSGLVEVMVSPIVEDCPTKRKSAMMSLLHSFYCWGHAAVVLLSSLFFVTASVENWAILAILWALIPFFNTLLFIFVPLPKISTGKGDSKNGSFLKTPIFWAVVVVMLCAGASEMSMAQWASSFAEPLLNGNKTLGDLLGPFLFAVLMGSARVLYAKFSAKISLGKTMIIGGIACLACFLLVSLSPNPIVAMMGCAICGLSVGIMWPGGLSTAAGFLPNGGISMFALLALAGDIGCLSGPTIVGKLSEAVGGDLRVSFLFATAFPVGLVLALLYLRHCKKKLKK